jgi:hypothetical protein
MNRAHASRVALYLAVAIAACCGAATAAPAWPLYRNEALGYAISYPPSWRVDTNHDYQALGPGKDIHGVAFVVSPGLAFGTNLSNDSYLAVEILPGAGCCTADRFLDDAVAGGPHRETHGRITYSVETGNDAGAGNFYEESVYAVAGPQSCLAIRYFIHSTNIDNYPAGSVTQFDKAKLVATFDKMRDSFRLAGTR